MAEAFWNIVGGIVVFLATTYLIPWIVRHVPTLNNWLNREPLRAAAGVGTIAGLVAAALYLQFLPPAPRIPTGLVIASLTECEKLDGDRWSSFQEGGGRFIVGAGQHAQSGDLDYTYAAFGTDPKSGEMPATGGRETIKLPKYEFYFTDETQPENHQVAFDTVTAYTVDSEVQRMSGGRSAFALVWPKATPTITVHRSDYRRQAELRPVENGESLQTLPPYIGLYFCKKNA